MSELWEASRSYLGVPWLDHGRSRAGLDCVGLVRLSIRDAYDYDIDPKGVLHRHMPVGDFIRATAKFWVRVTKDEARPGDVVAVGKDNVALLGILSPGAPLNLIAIPLKGVVQEGPYAPDRPIRGVFRCHR